MDVQPPNPSRTVILFHGKNFNGYYWKEVIPELVNNGYRVIVPDQLGWGKSDKPNIHYSFHLLATVTKSLLDSLKIDSAVIVGHSMGGMLATRFALMFPQFTSKMLLEDPIGLEDYKRFVPYRSTMQLFEKEKSATYESYKKYQQSYYPQWKPEYEQYVAAQAAALTDPAFQQVAWANALTYQMIYEQPVLYEFDSVRCPVLLITGSEDRTIVGKEYLTEEQKKQHGRYPVLGRSAALALRAEYVEFDGVGHIPHIQSREEFIKRLLVFLK